MTPSVAVVTPIWRPTLSDDELVRLQLTLRSTAECEHIVLHPDQVATVPLRTKLVEWSFQSCESRHLKSVRSYSSWLLTGDFYERFTDFDFIVIAQLDSVILRTPPQEAFDYDYLGAPWAPPFRVVVTQGRMRVIRSFGFAWGRQLEVGNGGLSIRHTQRMKEAAKDLQALVDTRVLDSANEDAVWAYYAKDIGLRLAPAQKASIFRDIEVDCDPDLTTLTGLHGLNDSTPLANLAVRNFHP